MDSNIILVDSVIVTYPGQPSISSDDLGNFIIAWKDNRNGNHDIWSRRYLSDCSPLGNIFQVNDDNGTATQSTPCVSADGDGKFIISWNDMRNGNHDVYAQRYLSSGQPIGNNYRISNTEDMRQMRPSVILDNNRIFSTWQDNRGGQTEYDIWVNVLDWDISVGIKDDLPSEISSMPYIFQNYPNPFNSSTKISYTLSEPGFVTLNIYDRLGRKIKSLVNKFQPAKTWSVNVDGSELESGIYFYRLNVGDEYIEVRKMILVR